jgi:hypothetical protein
VSSRAGALILSIVLAAALGPASAAAANFQSPSGNIVCRIEKGGVRCDIREASWQPTPKPSSCEFDWGSIGLERKGKGHFLCISDAIEPGGVLAYGDSIRRSHFRCTSRSSGIGCVNTGDGHGFKVSRERYRFF